MTPRSEHIANLLKQYFQGTLSIEEAAELELWQQQSALHADAFKEWSDAPNTAQRLKLWESYDMGAIKRRVQEQFPQWQVDLATETATKRYFHRIHFLKTAWFRYAAAIIVILTGYFIYNKLSRISESANGIVVAPSPQLDFKPGTNKAMLTLADGSKILLDSTASGNIAQQAGATIKKSAGGQIIYAFNQSTISKSVIYNTMSTPRGGQYQLILSDGSKVWLNAESSVTFPTVFTGNTREIKITGEAYFEIKKDKEKPFIVVTSGEKVMVLGTSFNINSYSDEPNTKVSLVEGAIKVNDRLLKPGQAFIKGQIINTNIAHDIAWINGVFSFQDADIKSVMRQLSRWYNIEVDFEAEIPKDEFSGELGRNLTLSQVMRLLGKARINYKIENNKITILREK